MSNRRLDNFVQPPSSPSSSQTTSIASVFDNNQPNYNLSGSLAKDTNTFKGTVIKYSEPVEARKPNRRWFLYPFKENESLEPIPLYRQSAFLLGRDRIIADVPIDHPSCSKQHAAIQFRFVKGQCNPYIIDLDSANGTSLNREKIEPRRYYQLLEKDVINFGYSTKDYVVMSEKLLEDKQEDLDS